jgi:broad specificity phosphatase PhoE
MENRDYRAFDGESTEDQIRRVAEFMDDLAALPDDERIAVVCHEGSLFSVLCYVLGVQLKYRQTEAGNASYSRFKRQNGVWKLVSWNEGSM